MSANGRSVFNRRQLRMALAMSFTFSLLLGICGCERKTNVKLVPGMASGNLNSPNSLTTVLPILNQGEDAAEDVQAESISIAGTTLTEPAPLPAALGMVPKDGLVNLAAAFTGTFTAASSYTIHVEGTFRDHGHRFPFAVSQVLKIPPAGPGSAASGSSSSPAQTVNGAHFPQQAPNFPREVNEGGHGWTVPKGPDRPAPPPSKPSNVQPAPKGDPPGIDFEVNSSQIGRAHV